MKNNISNVLKTESKVIAYVVICLVIIVLGISYALFFEVKGNEKNQIVKAGTLEFTYANGSQITNTTNNDCFIPMSNEEALTHSECEYKISITNTGTLPGNYNINLSSESVENPLTLSKLKIILKKEGKVVSDYPKEGTTTSLVENEKIEAGSVINYSVQVYIDKKLITADDDEKNISIKINGSAVVNSEEVNPEGPMPIIDYIKNIKTTQSGDGLYTVSHEYLEKLGSEWNQTEYRYAGVNPNNYISFNNEIWRIIGLVNVKTENGIDQRVKIVRQDGIEGQKDLVIAIWDNKKTNEGSSISEYGSNDWNDSVIKDMLNGIYYDSGTSDCYKVDWKLDKCDFTGNGELPKGLNNNSQNMIDKKIIWTLGGPEKYQDALVGNWYEYEKGNKVYNGRPLEWTSLTDVGEKYNGIGLLYPSDYGYAVGGDIRKQCLSTKLFEYNLGNCKESLWLYKEKDIWLISPFSGNSYASFCVDSAGHVRYCSATESHSIWPTIYLKSTVKILPNSKPDQEYGSKDNPFVLQ